jgi:hypothetical protein
MSKVMSRGSWDHRSMWVGKTDDGRLQIFDVRIVELQTWLHDQFKASLEM